MAIFKIPSYDDLKTAVLAKIEEYRPGAARGEGSDADVQASTLAHLVHGMHLHLLYGLLYNLVPTKASGWVLSAWSWLFGLSDGSGDYGRIKPRVSSVTDGFTFVALAGGGWVDLQDEVFTDSAGQEFKINESYTPAGAGTTPALDVVSVATGESMNLEVWRGEEFKWVTTPAFMAATITQVVDLDGGADLEQDGPLRARLAEFLQSPPMGGNWAHWRKIAEEASATNVDAWIWEGNHNDTDGYGCTDIACTQRGEDGEAKEIESTDALYDTINDALELLVMYGALFRVRFLDTNAVEQEVELTLTLNSSAATSQRCDWDARDVKFTVAAYNKTNKTITCSADCTGSISVGDRVIIYGAQAVVATVGITGGHALDTMFGITSWFTTYDEETNPFPWSTAHNPVTEPDHICSGGGLIINCIRALVEDVFRPLGPHKGTVGTSAPIPGWEYKLRLQNIQAAMINIGDAAGKAVIIDASIAVPAVDVSPAGPTPDTDVYFLYLGEPIIWEVKP